MKKENLIDGVLDNILKRFSARADFRTYNNEIKIDTEHPDIIWLRVKLAQTLQTELKKIAEDVIGEEEDTKYEEDSSWVKFYEGKNEKRKELISYFKSIGIEIN